VQIKLWVNRTKEETELMYFEFVSTVVLDHVVLRY